MSTTTPVQFLGRRRKDIPNVPGRGDVLALAGFALRYPDPWLCQQRDVMLAEARSLPDSPAARLLIEFFEWFAVQDSEDLRHNYVDTFDLRRRTCLFLTYFLHGDTRRRGTALLMMKQRYAAHGFDVAEGELVDYLPVALEFAARVGPQDGEAVLRTHRGALEMIEKALSEEGSQYRLVLEAITHVVGEMSASERELLASILDNGPPTVNPDDVDAPLAMPPMSCVGQGE